MLSTQHEAEAAHEFALRKQLWGSGIATVFLRGKRLFFIALRISKGKPDPVFFLVGNGGPQHVRCSFAEWQNIIETYPPYLTAQQASHVHQLTFQCTHFYHVSACIAANQSKLHWLIIPKMHLLNHMALDVLVNFQNVRAYHNFTGEDFMGILKKIAISTCTTSNMEERVLKRALLKCVTGCRNEVAELGARKP